MQTLEEMLADLDECLLDWAWLEYCEQLDNDVDYWSLDALRGRN